MTTTKMLLDEPLEQAAAYCAPRYAHRDDRGFTITSCRMLNGGWLFTFDCHYASTIGGRRVERETRVAWMDAEYRVKFDMIAG
jgi:hypothetical protein